MNLVNFFYDLHVYVKFHGMRFLGFVELKKCAGCGIIKMIRHWIELVIFGLYITEYLMQKEARDSGFLLFYTII